MPQSYSDINLHLIFSTKDRQPLIDGGFAPRLYEYIGGILRAEGCHLEAAGGMPDHVHLLVSAGRELSVAQAMQLVKGSSSKWIHDTFPERNAFAWQAGYGAFSVSRSIVPHVVGYIRSQAEHHRMRSFQEEFIAFLKRHQVAYDERYVWE